ncbi:hypothetical protein N7539_002949 [Penicillium diatomitis]|uniref:Homeobox and C2H2 transcription factor n=1 Tax=Penicillium diatomitis TaxID=2819901 RepID=A0A9X0BZP0_9EURO|nr:uncharacterized protein N7539_002949 [Penicillium diatomitis]KAJ5491382.1 hypothetical protein N7539_002949 [Penicillium diatomitis]
MEYFDFEGASSTYGSYAPSDDLASLGQVTDQFEERDDDFESLLMDGTIAPESAERHGGGSIGPDQDTGVYPMFRAQEPCDFCRHKNLDCFVAKRGMMQNECTCCISLRRGCSFLLDKVTGAFLEPLHPVSENALTTSNNFAIDQEIKATSYGTVEDEPDVSSRTKSARFSRKSITFLKTWLRDHHHNPYPTEAEKENLKLATGLSRTQISNWLANARRRGKARPALGSYLPASRAVDIPGQAHRPQDTTFMTPLERWKYSPPENEPAAIGDITRALANPPFDSSRQRWPQGGHVRPRRPGSSTNESSHASSEHKRYTASASSLDTSRSSFSDRSFVSALSHRSSPSFKSMDRKERRRRRKPSLPANTFNQQKVKAARPFKCTFCTDSFAAKYDWQRHEKSMHLILDKWICSPFGGVTEKDGVPCCVFCSAPQPDRNHLETHNYLGCQEKSVQERTFYRKDHLNQHLRLMHNSKFQPYMEKWQSSISDIKSRCGFCGLVMETWKDRVDHLAGHFKNGASMDQWQGDWGFEPAILERVENAVPPYLIDFEWRSPDPWGGAQVQADDASAQQSSGATPNCYMHISRVLTTYVRDQLAQGIIPTDDKLQAEARRVVYGDDDDGWNQTCADNPVWLAQLKRDTGLDPLIPNHVGLMPSHGMEPPFMAHMHSPPPDLASNAMTLDVRAEPITGPSVPSPSLQNSNYFPLGFTPVMSAAQGSLVSTYIGSTGIIAPGMPAFASNWSGGNSIQPHFDSAVGEDRQPDTLAQIRFDHDYLQHAHGGFSEAMAPHLHSLSSRTQIESQGTGNSPWQSPFMESPPLVDDSAVHPIAARYAHGEFPLPSQNGQAGPQRGPNDSLEF